MSTPAIENVRSLLELIHQSFLSSKSGGIVAEQGSQTGELGIEHGRLVHAHWGDIDGEDAFWAIIKTPGVATHFVENKKRRSHNIQRPAELILMDASIYLDQMEKDVQRALQGLAPAMESKKLVRRTTVVRLEPEAGEFAGAKCYVLDEGSHAVGRNPVCDIVIQDVTVSSHHVTLDVCNGAVTLRDEASRNGTYVNGTIIQKPVFLADGDLVTLGALPLKFFRNQSGQPVLIEQNAARPELSDTNSIPRA
jgi:hypothetical protein